MPYIYYKVVGKNIRKRDQAEDPEFAIKKGNIQLLGLASMAIINLNCSTGLPLDYDTYINDIFKPAMKRLLIHRFPDTDVDNLFKPNGIKRQKRKLEVEDKNCIGHYFKKSEKHCCLCETRPVVSNGRCSVCLDSHEGTRRWAEVVEEFTSCQEADEKNRKECFECKKNDDISVDYIHERISRCKNSQCHIFYERIETRKRRDDAHERMKSIHKRQHVKLEYDSNT